MDMRFKTKMRKNAGSMITVVPAALVNLFKADPGDELIWTINITKDGGYVTVKTEKSKSKE